MAPAPGPSDGWFNDFDKAMSEAVRVTMLQLLGAVAVLTGLLLALSESAGQNFFVAALLPGWPWVYGGMLTLGGVVQLIGMARDLPKIVMYACGLVGLWYALFAAMFLTAWIIWILNGSQETPPLLYPISVYIGMASFHAAQGLTIRKKLLAKHTQQQLMLGEDG